MRAVWMHYLLELPLHWQTQPILGAPKEFYSQGSTTNYCQQANLPLTILELDYLAPLHRQQQFKPIANRNVAMFRADKFWLFASSWLSAAANSKTSIQFLSLGQGSLGKILFNGAWQRSGFLFSEQEYYFCRSSYFISGPERIFLIEAFVKDTYNVLSHYAQTKPKMAHE